MYKTFYIFLFFILFCCEVKTQTEYITNGSFEQIDSCYGNYAPIGLDVFEWSGCKGWSNPIKSSSDLWCENPKAGVIFPPYIGPYFQYAKQGDNLGGFFTGFSSNYKNYREYLQNKLSNTLSVGTKYKISCYISQGIYQVSCSPVVIGVKFFNTKYDDNTAFWLTDLVPDAINDYSILKMDTLNWQQLTFTYTAKGNENYMIIGNFEDSLHLRYEEPCDTAGWGNYSYSVNYFFIDDISMMNFPYEEPEIPNVFTPNGDNSNDVWQFTLGLGNNLKSLHIYNRWGLEVKSSQIQTQSFIKWDGYTTAGEPCTAGVYFYTLEYSNVLDEQNKLNGYITLIK